MKTTIGKYFSVLSMLALLIACAPMDSRTSALDVETRDTAQNNRSDFDHDALVKQYEDLAREMQAKVQEQEEILEHKPHSSYFGKHGRSIKSHVTYKIRKYEKAAQEYLEKAAYHQKLAAEQTNRKLVPKPSQTSGQINKAKKN